MTQCMSLKISGEMTAAEFAELEKMAPNWRAKSKPKEVAQ